jgi:phage terminase large subunit
MDLTLKQTEAIEVLEDNTTNDLLFGGGAGGGKSAFGCFWQIKRRLMFPGTRGLIGRAILKTLKETTLVSFFEVAGKQGLKAGVHFRYNGQSNQIEFANQSVILLKDLFQYPSDPNFDELGSLEITDCFIDEANQITEKARNIVKSRVRFRLDEYGLIPKSLYTCNPAKNWVYTDFYRPSKEGTLQANRKFIQALLQDNSHTSRHYRENLLQLDENSRQRLLYGNWEYDNDPTTLIQYERILDCFSNTYLIRPDVLRNSIPYITCDVARFGSDRTVIAVWKDFAVMGLFVHSGLSVSQVGRKIKELQDRYDVPNSNTIADEDGVGGGVVDILGCKGFVNNSRPLPNPEAPYEQRSQPENYTNLKSQCYFRLAERINKGGLYIDCQDIEIKNAVIQELEQVKQYNMDKDGKRQVLPKDKVKELIGRSPDFADTLMMREWFELAPKNDLVMLDASGNLVKV